MFHNLSKKQDFSISNNLKFIEALTFKQTISLPTLRSGVRDLKIFFNERCKTSCSFRVIVLKGIVLRVKAKRCGGINKGSERTDSRQVCGKRTKGEVDFTAARSFSARRRGDSYFQPRRRVR